jgi:sarcosine oxidase gamma subunit
MSGDLVGSNETIVQIGAGVRTPRGNVEVVLQKDGRSRFAIWGARTLINIQRETTR